MHTIPYDEPTCPKQRGSKFWDKYWSHGIFGIDHTKMQDYKQFKQTHADLHPVMLSLWMTNPWQALELMGFDQVNIRSIKDHVTMECPYSESKYYGMVPFMILSHDVGQYNPHLCIFGETYARDADWAKDHYSGILIEQNYLTDHIATLHRGMMGTGYSDGWGPMDGSGYIQIAGFPIDNGDMLVCFVWHWANK